MGFIKRSVVNLDLSVEDLPGWLSDKTKADPAASVESDCEDEGATGSVEDSKKGE